MKALIRDYLASLKERDELDAILPDLLSELGFNVISKPQRGTRQSGVDIAAVGDADNGERKIFLFSVKQGNLTRNDWDGDSQALRSSLNEIIDNYIPNRISKKYTTLNIVICLAFGGDVTEQVRENLTSYINQNTTNKIIFEEWNGDKIAELLLTGIFSEKLLPETTRSSFRKAIAMVDKPDVSYKHFRNLLYTLITSNSTKQKDRVRIARQINICLWILYVWARDTNNLEAPYRASELALLSTWELLRSDIDNNKKTKPKEPMKLISKLIELHLKIALDFLEKKVIPYVRIYHGISHAIGAQNALDVNLALFELLGRIGLTGLWCHWHSLNSESDSDSWTQKATALIYSGLNLITNNTALYLPITDRQATDIALFLLLYLYISPNSNEVKNTFIQWLGEMAHRLNYTIDTRGRYPSCISNYRVLAIHPLNQSDDYFRETTAGSTLIPLLAAWLQSYNLTDEMQMLSNLISEKLGHCTLQFWMPDETLENKLFTGGYDHGHALCDLTLNESNSQFISTIESFCQNNAEIIENLSFIKTGVLPIIFVACRHHQLPIPPYFWINKLSALTES